MGEYAKRRSDGREIKIGTCEEMFYIRYEDRDAVEKLAGSLDCSTEPNLFWRLPFPDEDNVLPGDYMDHDRAYMLLGFGDTIEWGGDYNPGLVQLTHESGLLVNLPCYHGVKLPTITGDDNVKVAWNGKASNWFALSAVKNLADGEVVAIVRCVYCGEAWRYPMEDVLPYITDDELKRRLQSYNAKSEPEPEPVEMRVDQTTSKTKTPRKGSMDWGDMFK